MKVFGPDECMPSLKIFKVEAKVWSYKVGQNPKKHTYKQSTAATQGNLPVNNLKGLKDTQTPATQKWQSTVNSRECKSCTAFRLADLAKRRCLFK